MVLTHGSQCSGFADPNRLKKTLAFLSVVATVALGSARAQTGEWAWMGGTKWNGDSEAFGVYGQKGEFAAANVPGGREGAMGWADKEDHLWLFGGGGNGVQGYTGSLNDLWEFDPSRGERGEWAWISGSRSATCHEGCGQYGVYGTLGKFAATNTPGSRSQSATWKDKDGNLWLFGGSGTNTSGSNLENDLWEFKPSLGRHGEWAWIGGSNESSPIGCLDGNQGKLGVTAPGNWPSSRAQAAAWTDSAGRFWLFGGFSCRLYVNDLWVFDPSLGKAGEWAWMSGTGAYAIGKYGSKGEFGPLFAPGGRKQTVSWIDEHDNLWLFGGFGFDQLGYWGYLDDLWEFDPAKGRLGEWAWISGNSRMVPEIRGTQGVAGPMGTFAPSYVPGSRADAAGWIDRDGNLLLLSGVGMDANTGGEIQELEDLWKFDPRLGKHGEWAWIGGNAILGTHTPRLGTYGKIGVFSSENFPGARDSAVTWTDDRGNFWLFGGSGNDLNDLWIYKPASAPNP